MKITIQKIISISLVTYAFLGITAKQALANRDSHSLEMAVEMAQFRFGQKTRINIGKLMAQNYKISSTRTVPPSKKSIPRW